TAVYREFGKYIDGFSVRIRRFLESRPLAVFLAMVISILVSVGCFLFIPKKKPLEDDTRISIQQPMVGGMNDIVSTVSTLKELLEINAVLDGLLEKDGLDSSDSLLMEQAIDRVRILEKQLA